MPERASFMNRNEQLLHDNADWMAAQIWCEEPPVVDGRTDCEYCPWYPNCPALKRVVL